MRKEWKVVLLIISIITLLLSIYIFAFGTKNLLSFLSITKGLSTEDKYSLFKGNFNSWFMPNFRNVLLSANSGILSTVYLINFFKDGFSNKLVRSEITKEKSKEKKAKRLEAKMKKLRNKLNKLESDE